jgi:hypothetical protein
MDTAGLIERYLAGPELLRQVVVGLSQQQLTSRPVAGKWSTLEVICHIADFEPILADRMKRIIAEDRPALLSADENHFAARLAYHDRDLIQEMRLIEFTRQQMGRILRKLKADDFAREGVHSVRGPLTLAQVLESAANHIPHHVQFIQEKRSAMGV